MSSNYKRPGVKTSDKTKWDGTTTTVASNSASWGTGGGGDLSEVAAASGGWNSTQTTVNSNSGNWDSSYAVTSGSSYIPVDSIQVDYTPTNYSATTADVSGHFDGINTSAANWNSAYASVSGGLQNIINVAKNGDDGTATGSEGLPYLTVKAAMDSITDSADDNRYNVIVAPGVYIEDNPINLKPYTNMIGDGVFSKLSATNVSQPLISAVSFGTMAGITLDGASNSSAIIIDKPGIVGITQLTVINCKDGIELDNASAQVTLKDISILSTTGPVDNALHCKAGTAYCTNFETPFNASVEEVILAEGSDSVVYGNIMTALSPNVSGALVARDGGRINWSNVKTGGSSPVARMPICLHADGGVLTLTDVNLSWANSGIVVDNGGSAHIVALQTFNCNTALYAVSGAEVNDLEIFGGRVVQSANYDLYSYSSLNTIRFAGITLDESKMVYDGSDIVGAHISTRPGDEGFGIIGELHVGSPEQGKETVLGEGDSYTRGLLAYTYNGSTYTDISDDVKSNTGSTFTFPNDSVDTAIYLASDLIVNNADDYHKSYGMKMSLTTPQSGGSIVGEYYNGASWVEFAHMTMESGGDYHRRANDLFIVEAGSYQVRYNPFISEDWTATDDPSVDANDRYWVRYRIATTPDTLPVFEQWKLHSNRSEINADGYAEEMGDARAYITIPVPWSTFKDAGGNLSNQDLWFTTNTRAGMANNEYTTNGHTVGTITSLPNWADTSAPMRVRVAFIPTDSVSYTIKAFASRKLSGETVYTGDPTSTTGEITASETRALTADVVEWFEFELDLSGYGSQSTGQFPDLICINVEVDDGASADNIYGAHFEIAMLECKKGDHV